MFQSLVQNSLGCVLSVMGAPVAYEHKSGETITVQAVFDKKPANYEDGDFRSHSYVESFFVRRSDFLIAPRSDDRILKDGVHYRVYQVVEDGAGGMKLFVMLA